MKVQEPVGFGRFFSGILLFVISCQVPTTKAQGPAPESAPPLFPGGALISYSSTFLTRRPMNGLAAGIPATARPTFSHDGDFNFTWGFHPNFDVTVVVPIVTNHFYAGVPAGVVARGTGLGDVLLAVKYRFYRRDSERGTTQAAVTVGPKIPTGRTNLTDSVDRRLPASLQPSSGSTDLLVAANWTYTGLFHLRRLVADEDFHALVRSTGTESTRLGDDLQSRFWLSYRPYQSRNVAREWFLGPELTWLHSGADRISAVMQKGSGGDVLLAGITTFVGACPGMHVWAGMDWEVAHSTGSELHAYAAAHQFWNYAIVPAAFLSRKEER